MKTVYSDLDRQLKKIKNRIREEYGKLSIASFDELNVIGTRERTEKMYERLKAVNAKAYIKSAKGAYDAAEKSVILAGVAEAKKKTAIDDKWLLAVLGTYHLATGYLYNSETDRKRLRLNEEILTAREYGCYVSLRKAVKRAMDLWWTQSQQHGIYAVDDAVITAYRDYGIQKVRWISEMDGHECETCRERNDKIYNINEVPEKPHYGCRCRLEVVIERK